MSENKKMSKLASILRRIPAVFLAAAIAVVFGFPVYARTASATKIKQEKSASASKTNQMEFASPRQAFAALVNAAAGNDTKELLAIFGPDGKDLISSGDPVADTAARARFAMAAGKGVRFKKLDKGTFSFLALIGKDEWTFPIPIIKKGKSWIFLTGEGKQEIINRRIGRNELNTVRTSLAYVEAQREYSKEEFAKNGVPQYAQSFISHQGSRDGLYWPGKGDSPLGPLFARAACETNAPRQDMVKPVPYYGYYFNILKSQGRHAPGGSMDYVVGGRMTAGFGLVAYPAKYGASGVMTFMVNQQGAVYEKDLGPRTQELAKKITAYDPDGTWKRVDLTEASLP
ncbi:MAG: DUF2950 domain-containing protein [Nitrospiraceae bacterium]|nr:DUF2950 domain-containing protein [Nitrospiraceae bacterium]